MPTGNTASEKDIMDHAVASPNILVVDDTPANLRLLVRLLKDEGYTVRPAPSGRHALSVARGEAIDLILLDIMMPEMDGYEVCRQFKAQEATRDIPIIFLSALKETFDKVKAFESGGVDYITKPFQAEEVLARVKTHLSVCRMQQLLQHQNAQLQNHQFQLHQEIAERQRIEDELREANATKDRFFSIIAHDLRSPFTALLECAKCAFHSADTLSQEEFTRYLVEIKTSVESLYALLENLLYWSRVQRGVMEYQPGLIPLSEMVAAIFQLFRGYADHKRIVLRQQIPPTVYVYADTNMLNTVIRNLISNALKFTHAGGSIEITAQQCENEVEILVTDTGIGIPEADLTNVFRIDTKTSTPGTDGEKGTGLGLPLCKDLIEKNGGTIRIKSAPGCGSTIGLTLPCPPESLQTDAHAPQRHLDAEEIDGVSPAMPFAQSQMSRTPLMTRDELSAALAGLPNVWQKELREAATALDMETIGHVIDLIRRENGPLADALDAFAQQYQFHIIGEALESIA